MYLSWLDVLRALKLLWPFYLYIDIVRGNSVAARIVVFCVWVCCTLPPLLYPGLPGLYPGWGCLADWGLTLTWQTCVSCSQVDTRLDGMGEVVNSPWGQASPGANKSQVRSGFIVHALPGDGHGATPIFKYILKMLTCLIGINNGWLFVKWTIWPTLASALNAVLGTD